MIHWKSWYWIKFFDHEFTAPCLDMFRTALDIMCENEYTSDKARKFYLDYYEKVKKAVPKEKLLMYSVQEGWEPLCNFL